jgi:hypothetical protein
VKGTGWRRCGAATVEMGGWGRPEVRDPPDKWVPPVDARERGGRVEVGRGVPAGPGRQMGRKQ